MAKWSARGGTGTSQAALCSSRVDVVLGNRRLVYGYAVEGHSACSIKEQQACSELSPASHDH